MHRPAFTPIFATLNPLCIHAATVHRRTLKKNHVLDNRRILYFYMISNDRARDLLM